MHKKFLLPNNKYSLVVTTVPSWPRAMKMQHMHSYFSHQTCCLQIIKCATKEYLCSCTIPLLAVVYMYDLGRGLYYYAGKVDSTKLGPFPPHQLITFECSF